MPNWTENTLTLEGSKEDLLDFLANCCTDNKIDFAKIKPYPEGFDPELVSGSDEAYELYYSDDWQKFVYPWVREQIQGEVTRKAVIEIFAKRYEDPGSCFGDRTKHPTYKDLADAYKRNVEVSGHKTWYDWNTSNWGTKWPACDCTSKIIEDQIEMSFNTAWCEPMPIYEAIRDKYPKLFLEYVARHEGHDEITGRRWYPEEE